MKQMSTLDSSKITCVSDGKNTDTLPATVSSRISSSSVNTAKLMKKVIKLTWACVIFHRVACESISLATKLQNGTNYIAIGCGKIKEEILTS
jgi:hypothetical protein